MANLTDFGAPLRVRPIEIDTPDQVQTRRLQLQQLNQQAQLGGLQLEQARQAISDDENARKLFSENPNPSPAEILSRVGPTKGTVIIKGMHEAHKAEFDKQEQALKLASGKAARLGQIAGGIHDDSTWRNGAMQAVREGVVPPEALKSLPTTYDPALVADFQKQALSAVEQLKQKSTDLEDGYKKATADREAALAPFQARKAAADATHSEQVTTGKVPITTYQQEQLDKEKVGTDTPLPKAVEQQKIRIANASRPPAGMTTVMVPDANGGYTAKRIAPGDSVAPGSVTAAGMSSMNVPTAATRGMAEKAPRVRNFVARIRELLDQNEKSLGPLSGRWSEFTAGKVGLKDRGYTQLRTDAGLLQTALMQMHVGSRGGGQMMEHFKGLIDVSMQDPDNLRAALDEIDRYAAEVGAEGGNKGAPSQGTTGGGNPAGHSVGETRQYNGATYKFTGHQWEKQ